jgi:hypothetical protein
MPVHVPTLADVMRPHNVAQAGVDARGFAGRPRRLPVKLSLILEVNA